MLAPIAGKSQQAASGASDDSETQPLRRLQSQPREPGNRRRRVGKGYVTGYLVPRVGGGPQPVFTLDQDFITKQADQTINDVLDRYPGGLSNSKR